MKMRPSILGLFFSLLVAGPAAAENIGVTMAAFDDNFLTLLREGMQTHATMLPGVNLQAEDATNDVTKQLSQVQNFLASGVAAIIVNPVDTDATKEISASASSAGIPLVYVNRQPANADKLPAKQAFVGSEDIQAGIMQATEVCRLLKEAGKTSAEVVIIMGELSNQGARQRTQGVHDVLSGAGCSFIKVVAEQTANWQRMQGSDLVSNWLSAGTKFDAVLANNDEMAIGASQALKAAGVDMKTVLVAGVDATSDALAAMKRGDIAVTIFQDAGGQGKAALDTALKILHGEPVPSKVIIPFELVTASNIDAFMAEQAKK